jgi:hypothetical protein
MKTYHALCLLKHLQKPNDGTNEDLLVMPQLCPQRRGPADQFRADIALFREEHSRS